MWTTTAAAVLGKRQPAYCAVRKAWGTCTYWVLPVCMCLESGDRLSEDLDPGLERHCLIYGSAG